MKRLLVIFILVLLCGYGAVPVYAGFSTTSSPQLAKLPSVDFHSASGTVIRSEMRPIRVDGERYKIGMRNEVSNGSQEFNIYSSSHSRQWSNAAIGQSGQYANVGTVSRTGERAMSSAGMGDVYSARDGKVLSASECMELSGRRDMIRLDVRRLPGGNTRYINWIEKNLFVEYGDENVAAYWNDDKSVYWYGEARLKQLYDEWVAQHEDEFNADTPGYFTWDEFYSWLEFYSTTDGARHRLPMSGEMVALIMMTIIYTIIKLLK